MLIVCDGATPIVPSQPQALVSIVIGEDYCAVWNRTARPTWEKYAEIHGFDVIVITSPFDTSDRRSPAWQKCLILSQKWSQQYQRIVWIDADIVINLIAPNILDSAGPPSQVSATLVDDQLSLAEKHILMERLFNQPIAPDQALARWRTVQHNIYIQNKIDTKESNMVTTGVMVLSPSHHRRLLEETYAAPELSRGYEQPYLSHAILTRGLLHEISPRFNWGIWGPALLSCPGIARPTLNSADLEPQLPFLQGEFAKAYFLHFYQMYHVLKLLEFDWVMSRPPADSVGYLRGFAPNTPQLAVARRRA
jgi:hypothetical protein